MIDIVFSVFCPTFEEEQLEHSHCLLIANIFLVFCLGVLSLDELDFFDPLALNLMDRLR